MSALGIAPPKPWFPAVSPRRADYGESMTATASRRRNVRLGIEVDGDSHVEAWEWRAGQAYLERYGSDFNL